MKWITTILITCFIIFGITTVYAAIDEKTLTRITQAVTTQLDEATICGNDICQEGENHLSCAEDCGQEEFEPNIFVYLLIGMYIYVAIRRKNK